MTMPYAVVLLALGHLFHSIYSLALLFYTDKRDAIYTISLLLPFGCGFLV